jgi:hypothetical protein
MTKRYKIGGKVKILNNRHGGYLVVGSIGVIVNITAGVKLADGSFYPREFEIKGVEEDGNTDSWYYLKGDFEHAEDDTTAEI